MSYTPTEWKTGDVITAEKLNNMEGGISSLETIFPVVVNADMDVVNNNTITVKNVDYTYSEATELIESGKRPVFLVNLDLVANGSVVAENRYLFSNTSYCYNSQQSNYINASYFEVTRNSSSSPYIIPCFALNFTSNGMTIFAYSITVNA